MIHGVDLPPLSHVLYLTSVIFMSCDQINRQEKLWRNELPRVVSKLVVSTKSFMEITFSAQVKVPNEACCE